ncbi:hypothetical protein ABWJ92_31560 [Streptomyces sp. NPDC000609]
MSTSSRSEGSSAPAVGGTVSAGPATGPADAPRTRAPPHAVDGH